MFPLHNPLGGCQAMRMRFLNRHEECARLRRRLAGRTGNFICVYGRRRIGKTRLLMEVLKGANVAYYVGDDRESVLQKRDVARSIAKVVPGFDRVEYPDWNTLLERWWDAAPRGAVLCLDEFPLLASAYPALPSLLQKHIDRFGRRPVHTIVCGSSQRMMQGLILDATSPLFGRASEIIKVAPLGAHWIARALKTNDSTAALDSYAAWGGIPRYWELAADCRSHWDAISSLVLDPLGALHDEPRRLFLDDTRDIAQAVSILALIGGGCHRTSEIAGRLEKPATSLARPLRRLADMGMIVRERPFDAPARKSKRSFYRIADQFLRFWFRYVEPHRSLLGARQIKSVAKAVKRSYSLHVSEVWEDMARESVAKMPVAGVQWGPAARWWGPGLDKKPLEIDIVAESIDRQFLLAGEVKLRLNERDWLREWRLLEEEIQRLPFARGREVVPCLWYVRGRTPGRGNRGVSLDQVLDVSK